MSCPAHHRYAGCAPLLRISSSILQSEALVDAIFTRGLSAILTKILHTVMDMAKTAMSGEFCSVMHVCRCLSRSHLLFSPARCHLRPWPVRPSIPPEPRSSSIRRFQIRFESKWPPKSDHVCLPAGFDRGNVTRGDLRRHNAGAAFITPHTKRALQPAVSFSTYSRRAPRLSPQTSSSRPHVRVVPGFQQLRSRALTTPRLRSLAS